MMSTTTVTENDRHGLLRIAKADREKLERLLFHRYPDKEWGSFFRFGFRLTSWGVALTFVDVLKPAINDLDRTSPLVEFRPHYIGRALDLFEASPLAIGVIHSHPLGCAPTASFADDDMDDYFAGEFEKFSNGRPCASVIVSRGKGGSVDFTGRVFSRGQWLSLAELLTIGEPLKREPSFRPYSDNYPAPEIEIVQARIASLLGKSATNRLRNSTIAIIGCSGTGTPAAHVLARAGVGRLVLVDPGHFKRSNHERNHASRFTDLSLDKPPLKVELLHRLIKEISPDTRLIGFKGDLMDEKVLDELIRCDLILGCTDSHYARAALGDIAIHYLIPVLDLGVRMRAEEGILREQAGEITKYAPGLPCPWCQGRVDPKTIRYETATEAERRFWIEAAADAEARGVDGAQYWGGTPPPELTVGYLTTVVGALGAGYAEGWLTGAGRMPHSRFQFDLGLSALGVVADERPPRADCACRKTLGWADQAHADRSVSKPAHWPNAKIIFDDRRADRTKALWNALVPSNDTDCICLT
jgi:hypothetical protein